MHCNDAKSRNLNPLLMNQKKATAKCLATYSHSMMYMYLINVHKASMQRFEQYIGWDCVILYLHSTSLRFHDLHKFIPSMRIPPYFCELHSSNFLQRPKIKLIQTLDNVKHEWISSEFALHSYFIYHYLFKIRWQSMMPTSGVAHNSQQWGSFSCQKRSN